MIVTVDTKKHYAGNGDTYIPNENFIDNIYNELDKIYNFDKNRNFGAMVNVNWNGRNYDVNIAYIGIGIRRK